MAASPTTCGYIDTKPRIGVVGSGDGVFPVWSFGPWGQPMHCFRFCCQNGRLITGMVRIGQCGLVGQWDVSSPETRNDPGGRVSLPDQQ